jgi:hypothetical protein
VVLYGQVRIKASAADKGPNRFLRKDYGKYDLTGKIGISTPYKDQLYELRNCFRPLYGESITDIIEFNTTDAFQGRECEMKILSCVRAWSDECGTRTQTEGEAVQPVFGLYRFSFLNPNQRMSNLSMPCENLIMYISLVDFNDCR